MRQGPFWLRSVLTQRSGLRTNEAEVVASVIDRTAACKCVSTPSRSVARLARRLCRPREGDEGDTRTWAVRRPWVIPGVNARVGRVDPESWELGTDPGTLRGTV